MEDLNLGSVKPFYSFSNPFLALDYKDAFLDSSESLKTVFTQGCKWSPDGSLFLVASDNKKLRIFSLPQQVAKGEFNDENWFMHGWKNDVKPRVIVKEIEYVYDYQWFPLMHSADLSTCCFAVVCRGLPIHLWDAVNGRLICSYSYYNHLDDLASPYSLCFSPNGSKLVAGYSKKIQVFDVQRPGKLSTEMALEAQSGIISALAFHPELRQIFAAGSYMSSIGIYSLESKKAFALFMGHSKGVTHLQFSKDGTKLFSGTRMDDDIICWDIRNPGNILGILNRKPTTNQRMYFDISPNGPEYLVSGTVDGEVLVWDVEKSILDASNSSLLPDLSFIAHNDCVNGVSFHPSFPLLLTCCGQRLVPNLSSLIDSSSEEEEQQQPLVEKSVKLWWIGCAD